MNICDSIKKRYIRLSKGQRKVAQFVIDNPNIIASQIASEVGRLAGVSESTVIRFCYAMDLSGFSELQEKMKAYLVESGELPMIKQRTPKKKQEPSHNEGLGKTLAAVAKEKKLIDESVFEQAIQAVHRGQSIYIIGFRQAAPAALWLFNELVMIRANVHFIQHDAEDIARNLAMMDENAVLFSLMFSEEFEDIETVIAIAQRKNVKVIALGDQSLEKIDQQTTYLSLKEICSQETPRNIAIFSLLYTFIECVVQKDKVTYEEYREKYKEKKNAIQLVAIS